MALHSKVDDERAEAELDVNPMYVREADFRLPRNRIPQRGMLPDTALQVVRDDLILDGNARLNLATFVTTWMEPQADAADGGLPRQEHDRQGRVPADRGARAALREYPGRPLARPAGSGRRHRLLDHGLQRGAACWAAWRCCGAGARAAGRRAADATRPNLVMGANVQVCWEKFCRYWEVEPRMVPMEPTGCT